MHIPAGVTPAPSGVTQLGMVVMHVATGVSQLAVGVMHAGMVVMQFSIVVADVGSVVSHCAALCTRIPAGMSAAGSGALHRRNAPGHGPADVRYVSYVVGDGVVAVCAEEKRVIRSPGVVVLLVLFVSHGEHKSDAITRRVSPVPDPG